MFGNAVAISIPVARHRSERSRAAGPFKVAAARAGALGVATGESPFRR